MTMPMIRPTIRVLIAVISANNTVTVLCASPSVPLELVVVVVTVWVTVNVSAVVIVANDALEVTAVWEDRELALAADEAWVLGVDTTLLTEVELLTCPAAFTTNTPLSSK